MSERESTAGLAVLRIRRSCCRRPRTSPQLNRRRRHRRPEPAFAKKEIGDVGQQAARAGRSVALSARRAAAPCDQGIKSSPKCQRESTAGLAVLRIRRSCCRRPRTSPQLNRRRRHRRPEPAFAKKEIGDVGQQAARAGRSVALSARRAAAPCDQGIKSSPKCQREKARRALPCCEFDDHVVDDPVPRLSSTGAGAIVAPSRHSLKRKSATSASRRRERVALLHCRRGARRRPAIKG